MTRNLLKSPLQKTYKVQYFSQAMLRKMFLVTNYDLYNDSDKIVYERSSTIPSLFIGAKMRIYNGKLFSHRTVNRWMVGHKAGEFT